MNVFEAVKQSVTTRQAAEFYSFRVNRAGMIPQNARALDNRDVGDDSHRQCKEH